MPREAIPPEYILLVTMLRSPQHTIYARPRVDRVVANATSETCVCRQCGKVHRLGAWWCAGGCWNPITYAGINDRIAFFKHQTDRWAEVADIYGMTRTEFNERMSS